MILEQKITNIHRLPPTVIWNTHRCSLKTIQVEGYRRAQLTLAVDVSGSCGNRGLCDGQLERFDTLLTCASPDDRGIR